MIICRTISEMRNAVAHAKADGKVVGFVPTMGALHEGHLSLITSAVASCEFVVVSIFVNPTQFCPGEDFASYPKTIDADLSACESHGVSVVFLPSADEMYPQVGLTKIAVGSLGDRLCGSSREGHFDGVCTVVAKLFNIILPERSYFGMKDFQQAAIIKRMVFDLDIPVEIILCPTVRERDGLAMSSRNTKLDAKQRAESPAIYRALQAGAKILATSSLAWPDAIDEMRRIIETDAPLGEIDYIVAVDSQTLQDVSANEDISANQSVPANPNEILLAVAVNFPTARLIDNILVKRG